MFVPIFILLSASSLFTEEMKISEPHIRKVAIIGGGAAGLVTASVLSNSKLEVAVFEQTQLLGGVWNYAPASSSVNPMYNSLRTNLPTEIMSISYDDPFILRENDNTCTYSTSFATHSDVLRYIENYADKYSLRKFVLFNTTVTKATRVDGKSWSVSYQTTTAENSIQSSADFDALIVCNGHFSKPFVPPIPGLNAFTGVSMHSIDYDKLKCDLSPINGKRVLIVGGKSSATDMAREIIALGVAAEVHISDRNLEYSFLKTYPVGETIPLTDAKLPSEPFFYFHPAISHVEEGTRYVKFSDSLTAEIDLILWCTGYLYEYPFLGDLVQLEQGKRLRGLHMQLFHQQEPTLAFVGLPFAVVPFPLFFFQAKLLAAVFKVIAAATNYSYPKQSIVLI